MVLGAAIPSSPHAPDEPGNRERDDTDVEEGEGEEKGWRTCHNPGLRRGGGGCLADRLLLLVPAMSAIAQSLRPMASLPREMMMKAGIHCVST
jgi:hypothetical protein